MVVGTLRLSRLSLRHCSHIVVVVVVVVVVALWWLWLWLWLLLRHGRRRGCCIVIVLSWLLWSWSWSHRSHCCVVSTKSRLSRRPLACWPGVESQNMTIRCVIGAMKHDIPPLVIFVVTSSHCRRVIVITIVVSSPL